MKTAYGTILSAGILFMGARMAYGAAETGFGIDGMPEDAGPGFFALCIALCLAFYLFPVLILKRRHGGRRITGGTIPYLPFSESFHLADSGVTISRRPSERERDGAPTFRPFSFP